MAGSVRPMVRLLPGLLLVVLLATPSTAYAGALDGTWRFTGAQEDLDGRAAAIDQGAQRFPALIRGIARKRIERNAIRPDTYRIADEGDAFVMQVDDGPARRTDLAGTTIEFVPDGRSETVRLARRRVGDAVHSKVISETGWLETHLQLRGALLSVTITLSSERLPAPVVYTLTYSREG